MRACRGRGAAVAEALAPALALAGALCLSGFGSRVAFGGEPFDPTILLARSGDGDGGDTTLMYFPADDAVWGQGALPAGLRSVGLQSLGQGGAGWQAVRGPRGATAEWAALAAGGRLRRPWPVRVKDAPETLDIPDLREDTRAAPYRAAGLDGRGVTVAVIDLGFAGLDALPEARRPRRLLPVPGLSLREEGLADVDHGTAVVEVLAGLAPEITVWTAAVSDEAQLLEAMAALLPLQPAVVVAAIGFDNQWPADGTSPVSAAVSAFVEETGAQWVAAAGNEHGRYRWGTLTDADGDGRLEIGGLEGVLINTREGAAEVRLRWMEPMGRAELDFGVALETLDGLPCAASDTPQDGRADPVDEVRAPCPGSMAWAVPVWAGEGPVPPIEAALYAPDGVVFGEETEGRELTLPADARGALAVGACRWRADGAAVTAGAWVPRAYSSRGPTEDGRPAPQLCAPDGLELNSVDGGFFGTSGSAPVVAGLLALALDGRRRADPLEAIAPLDLGAAGQDTASGEGLARLGPPPCACAHAGGDRGARAGIALWVAILGLHLHRRRRALASCAGRGPHRSSARDPLEQRRTSAAL